MAEKREQIIILGLSHKVCCLLPSPSYCNMVYALRLTRSHLSLSLLLYFNERSAVKERARHACDPNTNDWGQVKVYSPLPTLTLGLVFFRVVFTFGLPCFLPLVSMTIGHCNASLEPPKYKEQKTQTQGARKSSRLQLCRPKFIVKFPKCWIMLKKLNEIKISFYNIARFITVTFKNKFRSPTVSHQKVYLQTTHSEDTLLRQPLKCPSLERLDCPKKIKGNNYFKRSGCLFLG